MSEQSVQEGLDGYVRNLQVRNEGGQLQIIVTIWTFVLDRVDVNGNALIDEKGNAIVIPVEMRGHEFQGFINEGDLIRLFDTWSSAEIVRTHQVYNFATNSYFVARTRMPSYEMSKEHPYLRKKAKELNRYAGEVRGLVKHNEGNDQIWRFHVYRLDNYGKAEAHILVELRGTQINGTIYEGDQVVLLEKWKEGKIVQVKELFNLTTYTMVRKL